MTVGGDVRSVCFSSLLRNSSTCLAFYPSVCAVELARSLGQRLPLLCADTRADNSPGRWSRRTETRHAREGQWNRDSREKANSLFLIVIISVFSFSRSFYLTFRDPAGFITEAQVRSVFDDTVGSASWVHLNVLLRGDPF